jgi:hypothetical protein
VALLAMTLIAFELIATRLFSVILWNHFAFLAISVALFGFGVAGVGVHLLPRVFTRERAPDQIRACALLLPLVLFVVVLVVCRMPIDVDFSGRMFGFLALIFLLTSLPFVVGGVAITLALTHWTHHVNRIYAWDLVGSTGGCLLVIPLLDRLDGPTAVIALGVLAVAAAAVVARPVSALALGGLVLGAVAVNLQTDWVRVRVARSHVQQPLFEQWNAYSRVTVAEAGRWRGWWVSPRNRDPEVPVLGIQIDADAFTPMIRYDGDLAAVRVVLADLTSAAYELKRGLGSVLVIGAGGGKDVLAALAAGATRVRAVELNPIIARRIVSEEFAGFTGDPYRDPRVELIVGEGRTVLRHDDNRYDVLQVSMVDTSAAAAAGAYALTENSLYTIEAAGEYLEHLEPGGVLTTTWANFPNLEGGYRLVSQYAEALRRAGRLPVRDRIAVLTGGTAHKGFMPLYNVLVKPDGFTAAEVARLRSICGRRGFVPVYLPGDPLDARGSDDRAMVRRLVGSGDLDAFLSSYRLDLRPVSDDRPFFFYQFRLRDSLKDPWGFDTDVMYGNGMTIIVKLLLVSALSVLLFIGLPMLLGGRAGAVGGRRVWGFAPYFLCLGVGFIVVELALVHMFGYYLGHPLLGLGVSLASILLFTGIGSALGGRWSDTVLLSRLRVVLVTVVALGAVYHVLLPRVMDLSLGRSLGVRIAVVVLAMGPLGTLLGLPFPSGLRLLGDRSGAVPWMWAINAGATVLGSALATMMVMHLGFSLTILLGSSVYALALLFTLARPQTAAAEAQRSR